MWAGHLSQAGGGCKAPTMPSRRSGAEANRPAGVDEGHDGLEAAVAQIDELQRAHLLFADERAVVLGVLGFAAFRRPGPVEDGVGIHERYGARVDRAGGIKWSRLVRFQIEDAPVELEVPQQHEPAVRRHDRSLADVQCTGLAGFRVEYVDHWHALPRDGRAT